MVAAGAVLPGRGEYVPRAKRAIRPSLSRRTSIGATVGRFNPVLAMICEIVLAPLAIAVMMACAWVGYSGRSHFMACR
jgi:hypothetical protein